MKVLIISANTLPASPTGPAYMAGAALRAGHTVEVFETLFSTDVIESASSAMLKGMNRRYKVDDNPGSERIVR